MLSNFRHLGIYLFIFAISSHVTAWASPCGVSDKPGFEFPRVPTEVHTPDQIQLELDQWIEQSLETHPKLDVAMNIGQLFAVKSRIREQLVAPMNQLEIFRLFTLLNPVFADAHHGIMLPGTREQIVDAIKAGDRLFPVPVHIDQDFRLMAKSPFAGMATGTIIHSINGVDSIEITKHLEQHARGDNVDFRLALVEDRFAELLWQHFGSAEKFVLGITQADTCELITVDGGVEMMPHRRITQAFDDQFSFELLANDTVAYLRADTFFLPERSDDWFAFTETVFNQSIEAGSQHLIIDIRENGGGDDVLWMEGIMPYIASKKWQRMLHFLGRVRETDEAFPGRVGETAIFDYTGEYDVSDKPKFKGKVYVMTGRRTYSSAIMFASAFKDNQLGIIVGVEMPARGCSTGMPKYHEMKTSGLAAFTPQHWYQRNTTASCMTGVEVDLPLSDDPFDEWAMVNDLVDRIIAN